MRKANRDQYKKMNTILTNSFKENKSVNYVLRGKSEKYISKLMDYSLYNGENFGEIFINDDETACAIMIDPNRKRTTVGSVFQDLKFVFTISGLSNLKKVYSKEIITKNAFPKDIDFVQL